MTTGHVAPPVVKGLIWFTDGSRKKEGTRPGVQEQSVGRSLSISLGRSTTVFQAEIHATLAHANEIQMNVRQEKYVLALTARWL
jgi:hypothetical protein